VVAAVTVSFASMGVDAGGPVALTERQLDNVTAGQGAPPVFAGSAAAASGLGLITFGGTETAAVTGIGSLGNDGPFGGSTAQQHETGSRNQTSARPFDGQIGQAHRSGRPTNLSDAGSPVTAPQNSTP